MARISSSVTPGIDLTALEQQTAAQPDQVDGWLRLGWARYGSARWEAAEQAFRTAHRLAGSDPEPPFGLGLALKKQGKKPEAIRFFREAAERTTSVADRARAAILRRLALGHVNFLEQGEWNLEREVWGRA
jgi:cytochrome c-type biogenesis protein CcmH/NrfG